MVVVALVALALAVADAVRMSTRAAGYRRIADSHQRLVQTLRAIDGWDEEAKVRYGVVYPASNRKLTPHYERMMKLIPYDDETNPVYRGAESSSPSHRAVSWNPRGDGSSPVTALGKGEWLTLPLTANLCIDREGDAIPVGLGHNCRVVSG
jgi:hypothetical protein